MLANEKQSLESRSACEAQVRNVLKVIEDVEEA
jgi:hypothetical protein